jgi:hypothetical protein
MKNSYKKYSDVYYDRLQIGVKANTSLIIQISVIIICAGAGAVLALPLFKGETLALSSIVILALVAIALLTAAVRLVAWLAYPKTLIVAKPGGLTFFPGKKREFTLERGDIIKIRQNDWWNARWKYASYSISVFSRYGGVYKIRYVKDCPETVKLLKQLRYNRGV